MKKIVFILQLIIINLCVSQVRAQNQLPLENGNLEIVDANGFEQWTNLQTNGGNANYSIETIDVSPGSTKALKSEIHSLGTQGYHVSTRSDYEFEVVAGGEYTVSFYAKAEGLDASNDLQLVFQSAPTTGFQSKLITLTNSWTLYTHTFTAPSASVQNRLKFWYEQADVTYFIDQVSVVPVNNYVSLDFSQTDQTIEGFGAGIKRSTEKLYALPIAKRQDIEEYCFKDLEVNMIRFFVYNNIEDSPNPSKPDLFTNRIDLNDNANKFVLNEDGLDWRIYGEDQSGNRKGLYVAKALQSAINLSRYGFDEIIGNANTAPGWMKKNGTFKRLEKDEDILLNTLIPGMEEEYSEFLTGFLKGMNTEYGIDVTAISPTNEPDYKNVYRSMNLTPIELAGVLKNLKSRLTSEGLGSVKIISAENALVSQKAATPDSEKLTVINSATEYMNIIFQDTVAKAAVDIVGTHTYFDDEDNPANWSALKTAASGKPVWVTESANLGTTDRSMTDAAYYIKWMIKGFNDGGMTAYMIHTFYQNIELDDNGDEKSSSSLVLWDATGEIILPKRYHAFKHFANLVKKGYKRVKNQNNLTDFFGTSFISPNEDKVVSQIFNEGAAKQISVDVPVGTKSIKHYVTKDEIDNGFQETNFIYTLGDHFITFNATALSLHSFVFEIDKLKPSAVSALASSNITNNSFDLSWTEATDDIDGSGVTAYKVIIDGALNGTTSSTSYSVSDLLPNITYNISVIALDGVGNESTSLDINVTTLPTNSLITSVAGPDTVLIGDTVDVSVAYESAVDNDIVVFFQRDNNPYTTYKSVRTTVPAGSGTLIVPLPISSSITIPVASDDYKYYVFITAVGDTYDNRIHNYSKIDISTTNLFFVTNKATGTYLHATDLLDGTLLKTGAQQQTDYFKWEKIAISGSNYFYFKNVASGRYFRPDSNTEGSNLVQRSNTWSGDYTQWQEVTSPDGEYFYLQNKESGMYFRPTGGGTSSLDIKPITFNGDWTRWSYEAATATGGSSKAIASKKTEDTLLTNDVIKMYPNPIKQNQTLFFDLGQNDTDNYSKLDIYNIQGRLIYSKPITSNRVNINIDTKFSKGFYIISLSGDKTVINKKLIVE